MNDQISIEKVKTKAERKQFIEISYRLNANDPYWVPPLRGEFKKLITPGKNPFFEHAEHQYYLAYRDGEVVGRISAHIDRLALEQPPEQGMGPGTGNWGLLEAEDEAAAQALIARAESWLVEQGMTRVIAPMSLSVWEEPGLLVKGHDTHPVIMMGHDDPRHQQWIESSGYREVKRLYSYVLPVKDGFPPIVQRFVRAGERRGNIRIRSLNLDDFANEVAIILDLLNDAWSDNWGFVPLTQAEIDHVGKELKPLGQPKTNLIAEMDGKPVAFMLALPDINELIKPMKGRLNPWKLFRLWRWLRNPQAKMWRVPLMGVKKELQNTPLSGQLAFMMIEYIRRAAVGDFGAEEAEIGWVLDDNKGMKAIADAIQGEVKREYAIYEKALG